MKFPGKISISRITSNREVDLISIRIIDSFSYCEFTEVLVSVENFGLAITGRSDVECEVWFHDKAPLGKNREFKTELIPALNGWIISHEEATLLLAPFEVDGWKGQIDTLLNSHYRVTGPNGERLQKVSFVRYADPEEA